MILWINLLIKIYTLALTSNIEETHSLNYKLVKAMPMVKLFKSTKRIGITWDHIVGSDNKYLDILYKWYNHAISTKFKTYD